MLDYQTELEEKLQAKESEMEAMQKSHHDAIRLLTKKLEVAKRKGSNAVEAKTPEDEEIGTKEQEPKESPKKKVGGSMVIVNLLLDLFSIPKTRGQVS